MDEQPKTLSIKQTAKLLNVSEWTVRQMIARRELPHLRLGGRVMVPKERFERWFESRIKGVA